MCFMDEKCVVVVVTYCHSSSAHRALELLPKAPPPEPRKLTDKELKQLNQQEEATMRELRLFLRDILNKLGRDRKFQIFAKPVDEEEVITKFWILFLFWNERENCSSHSLKITMKIPEKHFVRFCFIWS